MGVFIYNLFLFFFKSAISLAAPFNEKARKWKKGRKDLWKVLNSAMHTFSTDMEKRNDRVSDNNKIWIHCASLGEFEQGRPVIEKIKELYPGHYIILTFFSPSGYEVRKNYSMADLVSYLPLDSSGNARRFLDLVNPQLVIFVKYEFWFHYLRETRRRNIPLLLISAIFRKDSVFFRWYGGLHRKMLDCFSHLFVQNEISLQLLHSIGFTRCTVTGDTRFDRVIKIAEGGEPIPAIEKIIGDRKVIVAGSTWPADERILAGAMKALQDDSLLLIIAPHEITPEHIMLVQQLFVESIRYSALGNPDSQEALQEETGCPRTLIIDNIGMLSRLYRYGFITYVGGGFGKGIHNTLEAAVYGKPVLFGPVYQKFNEAVELIKSGAAISIQDEGSCGKVIRNFLDNGDLYNHSCLAAKNYVFGQKGATEKIMKYIQENRLLIS